MKTIYVLIISLLIGCAGTSPPDYCKYIGDLCDQYPEEVYQCEDYDYPTGYMYLWYEIWDDGDWVIWHSYYLMYKHYCN